MTKRIIDADLLIELIPSVSLQKLMNTWDVNDVCTWLGDLGLSQYAEIFRTNDIDGIELSNVDNKVLGEDLGIGMTYNPSNF